ncbi:MAG: creatininase family protein [Nitrososphaerota archaeon]|nr:creatininase family protein [Nitrososphaerota archaeon]
MSEVNSTQIASKIGKIETLVLPIGTFEAHGPHASVMTDSLIVEKLSEGVEQRASGRVFVAPVIPYGHTWHLIDRPGSHNVSDTVLSDYVFEVMKGFLPWKVKNIVIVNGHHDQLSAIRSASEKVYALGMRVAIVNWWLAPFWNELKELAPGMEGHAGGAETSLIWYVGEKYVDEKLIPTKSQNFSFKVPVSMDDLFSRVEVNKHVWPNAYFGNPSSASPKIGEALFERSVELIVKTIDNLQSDDVASS